MALMKPAVIPEFFARLKKAMPEPETELEYDNFYQLLVAVVLSAQATDIGVNRATTPLFKIVKTPQQMVKLGEKKLIDYIKTIGLFRTKAKNVIALSHLLIERHGGEVPKSHEALQEVPGGAPELEARLEHMRRDTRPDTEALIAHTLALFDSALEKPHAKSKR